jgi:hypothetical protein
MIIYVYIYIPRTYPQNTVVGGLVVSVSMEWISSEADRVEIIFDHFG